MEEMFKKFTKGLGMNEEEMAQQMVLINEAKE